MTVGASQILDEYLGALEGELRDLPPADRAEIVLEVKAHFEDARRELTDPTEAQLRNIVERLGPPAEIAAEARERLGVEAPGSVPGATPVATALPRSGAGLLEILAVVMWVIWWPIGVLLMALSSRWSRRDKAIALAVEFGVIAILNGAASTVSLMTGGTGGNSRFWLLWVFLLFPPSVLGIIGASYLTWRLAVPGGWAWSGGWAAAARTALVLLGAWLVWSLAIGPLILLAMKTRSGG